MSDATFARPDLTTFCRLDELGLEVTGQRLEPDRAVLACRVVEPDRVVPALRLRGRAAGHRDPAAGARAVRVATDDAAGHGPPLPVHRVRACVAPGHQPGGRAAGEAVAPRAAVGAGRASWCQHLTVARVAEGLGVSWNTANDAVLAEGRRVLIDDPTRFDGVQVIGVDEHVWRHTRRGDKYVTVIIDLTPIRDGTGPARLLDMVEGRSKQAFKTWLADRPQAWRDGVEVVAMDGFTGFKTATTEELPDAVAVMDPFHVVRLAGDALDRCRRRVQQDTPRPPRPHRRPALRAPGAPCTPAPTCSPTSRQQRLGRPVRRRRTRRGRGHLGHLPADDRRLPRTRPAPRAAS